MQFLSPKIRIQNKSFRLRLREDRAVLIVCFGIALTFWLLVKLSQVYRTDKNVVFQLRIPSEKAFLETPPKDMVALIEGQGWDLTFDFFYNPNIVLQFDLLQNNRLDLDRAQLRTAINNSFSSKDIKIIELNYEELHLLLEEKMNKKVPVRLYSNISAAPEYELRDQPILSPDSVVITGPASVVESFDHWNTDSLIRSDLKSSVSTDLRLEPAPSELTLSQAKIKVEVPVEQITEKSFFIPIQVLNASDSINIFPKTIRLTCSVGLSRYEELSASDFQLVVDLIEATSSETKNTAPIILQQYPDYVENIKYSPLSVEFFIVEPEDEPNAKEKSPDE
jgi:hypothetical protein